MVKMQASPENHGWPPRRALLRNCSLRSDFAFSLWV